MIYRSLAERLDSDSPPEIPWEKVIVVGFNALSKSELKLFDFLRNSGKALFYWDYHNSYINEKEAEAGRFLRKNIQRFPNTDEFHANFGDDLTNRNIKVFNLPSDVLQSKQLYTLLENQDVKSVNQLSDTAIILGDESLLPTILSSLPEGIKNLNITMGYPVSQTPVYSFIDHILKLQQSYARKKSGSQYYFRDVLSVLNHQYLQSFYRLETEDLIREIHRRNKIYLPFSFFKGDPVLEQIFKRISNAEEMMIYLQDLLDSLLKAVNSDDASFKLEKEYIFIIKTRLIKLYNLFTENPIINSLDSFIRLFRKILSVYNIPFQGEPLKGVQLMGILESRLLDFKNLYVLSLNEGVMPASQASSSFIPANLRHAFEMPVREDKDAIYAYYFFRLLQRAENVYLLYNSKSDGAKSGEPSRYIYQLKYLTDPKPESFTGAFSIYGQDLQKIVISKSPEVMSVLSEYLEGEGERYLSPSALSSYLDCSLKFYFSYVAGMKEEDEASDEIDASGFGSLFHKTMELIYEPYIGKEIRKKDYLEISKSDNIRKQLDSAFRSEFLNLKESKEVVRPEGKNIIVYEIIFNLVEKCLELDKDLAPFTYLEAEKKVEGLSHSVKALGSVRLGGKIDRIDLRNGRVHILDYKTGKADLQFPSLERVFDRDKWGSKNLKGVFQTFLYCYVYHLMHPEEKILKPGIYLTSELFVENFTTELKNTELKSGVLNYLDYHDEFKEKIEELLKELFNPDISFKQTEDHQRCSYCLYSEICHR